MNKYGLIISLLTGCAVQAQHFIPQAVVFGVGAGTSGLLHDAGVFNRKDGSPSHDIQSTGAWHIGYKVMPASRVDLGAELVGELQKRQTTSVDPTQAGKYKINRDRQLSLLISSHFHWVEKEHLQCYSGAGIGLNFQQRRESRNDFSTVKDEFTRQRLAWQATAIGVRVGKKVGGYLELGYGYKGLVLAGLILKL